MLPVETSLVSHKVDWESWGQARIEGARCGPSMLKTSLLVDFPEAERGSEREQARNERADPSEYQVRISGCRCRLQPKTCCENPFRDH